MNLIRINLPIIFSNIHKYSDGLYTGIYNAYKYGKNSKDIKDGSIMSENISSRYIIML